MDDLKEILENKVAVVIVIIIAIILGSAFGMHLLIDKVSDKVIEKLKRDYVPGPYSPGIDPDKVNPNLWRNQQPQQVGYRDWESDWELQRLR
jgi:hypothetical protein